MYFVVIAGHNAQTFQSQILCALFALYRIKIHGGGSTLTTTYFHLDGNRTTETDKTMVNTKQTARMNVMPLRTVAAQQHPMETANHGNDEATGKNKKRKKQNNDTGKNDNTNENSKKKNKRNDDDSDYEDDNEARKKSTKSTTQGDRESIGSSKRNDTSTQNTVGKKKSSTTTIGSVSRNTPQHNTQTMYGGAIKLTNTRASTSTRKKATTPTGTTKQPR